MDIHNETYLLAAEVIEYKRSVLSAYMMERVHHEIRDKCLETIQ